jgi:hypothetical protein
MILPDQIVAFQDQDNFVRNLVTIRTPAGFIRVAMWPDASGLMRVVTPPSQVSKSAAGRVAAVDLVMLKAHLRIEPDNTDEDAYLAALEMGAHIHVENVTRRVIDDTVGENVKIAIMLLAAHWYRHRETVAGGTFTELPQTVAALLSAERDYTTVY